MCVLLPPLLGVAVGRIVPGGQRKQKQTNEERGKTKTNGVLISRLLSIRGFASHQDGGTDGTTMAVCTAVARVEHDCAWPVKKPGSFHGAGGYHFYYGTYPAGDSGGRKEERFGKDSAAAATGGLFCGYLGP